MTDLDPHPYVFRYDDGTPMRGSRLMRSSSRKWTFNPRAGYSQDEADYA